MNYFLKTENIEKKFSNHVALSNVGISVPEGSIFGLLGPNGAGKTTLIRIINRITAPDKGEVFFNGEKLSEQHISQIGYLPEERGLYKKMKVGEQALYFAQLKGMQKNIANTKLKEWFEKFEISNWWNKKVEELSKGMQQKVQFIITILHEPKLLIFDEPFSGFDPINAQLLKNEILELKKKGSTIIFSTHNMASVEELCDYIALINNSKKVLEGQVHEIKKEYKSNIYNIALKNKIKEFRNDENYKIINQTKENGTCIAKIELSKEKTTNDLLNYCMNFGEIDFFNEVIPSINDIFINIVNQTKSAT